MNSVRTGRSDSAMRITLTLCAALLTLLTLGSASALAQGANDLPDIGSGANSTLTINDEYQLGLMVVRGLRDQGLILEDPEVSDYIQNLGSKIAAQIQDSEQRFTFFVVREGNINAFALPGGFIGVNYGLITATANESQLASVIAHEIAHVTQRHIARAIQAQGRQGLASAAALLAAILIGMTTGASDAVQAGIAIAQGTAAQAQINFTRSNEYEADRIGISYLAAAGFDPQGMPDFFETLSRRSGLAGAQVPEFLRTHPVTANRVAETRERAGQIRTIVRQESAAYAFVRERVRVARGHAERLAVEIDDALVKLVLLLRLLDLLVQLSRKVREEQVLRADGQPEQPVEEGLHRDLVHLPPIGHAALNERILPDLKVLAPLALQVGVEGKPERLAHVLGRRRLRVEIWALCQLEHRAHRLAPVGRIHVEVAQVARVRSPTISLGERSHVLQPLAQHRGKAALAAGGGHDEAVLGPMQLVGAVSAPTLLDALVRTPWQLECDVHAYARVGHATVGLERNARRGRLRDDRHELVAVHEGLALG